MLDNLSSDDKVSEIYMAHRHPRFKSKIFLIVEGASDVRLFSHLINDKEIIIESSYGGKEQLIKIISKLHDLGDQAIIGICDADFDRLEGTHEIYHDKHLYMTDAHDIEMMMILSKSRRKVVSEFCNHLIINDIEDNFIDVVCGAAYEVGLFRWINKKEGGSEGLRLNFKGMKYGDFFTFSNFSFEFKLIFFIDELCKRTNDLDAVVTKKFLHDKYNEYKSKQAPLEQVCCGHDMSQLACIFINQDELRNGKKIAAAYFESVLRASYEKGCFSGTMLYNLFNVSYLNKKKLLND